MSDALQSHQYGKHEEMHNRMFEAVGRTLAIFKGVERHLRDHCRLFDLVGVARAAHSPYHTSHLHAFQTRVNDK